MEHHMHDWSFPSGASSTLCVRLDWMLETPIKQSITLEPNINLLSLVSLSYIQRQYYYTTSVHHAFLPHLWVSGPAHSLSRVSHCTKKTEHSTMLAAVAFCDRDMGY